MNNIICVPSLLVSNVLDPYTKTKDDILEMYSRVSKLNRYKSIETRVFEDDDFDKEYLDMNSSWSLTYWITGHLSRGGYNLSDISEQKRIDSVKRAKELIDIAMKTKANFIGIASGKADENNRALGIDQFEKSVKELLEYISINNYDTKILIEPLDAYAHKKNVIGDTKTTIEFLSRFDKKLFEDYKLSICWDSAHVALNNDDLKESIKNLAPYISRVHFANAILDKNNPKYGDWHLGFCKESFLNVEVARSILNELNKYKKGKVFVAVEIKCNEKDKAWDLEKECYQFYSEVTKDYNE